MLSFPVKVAVSSALNANTNIAVSNILCCPAADGDPHFLLELPERHDALCFNINDKPGTIFNLVTDPKSGLHHLGWGRGGPQSLN